MLIGRAAEQQRIREFLDTERRGGSGALLVRGEAGVGKTALLDYARESVGRGRVVESLCVESETTLAFGTLATVAGPLLGGLADLPPRQSEALAAALAIGPPVATDRLAVAAALLALLVGAAERGALLVLIDDAHCCDLPSREALLFAARRLREGGVRMLFASRDGEIGSLVREGIPELVVGPLAAHDAISLLTRGEVTPQVAAAIHAATGGNPMALLSVPALLTVDQLQGRSPLADPLPVGSAQAAFARLAAGLPDWSRRALLVACADGSGRAPPLARALDHLGIEREALTAVEQAGLLATQGDRVTVRHPLVRSAVYYAADAGERRATHAALATAYVGLDPDRRAWHLAKAAPGFDADAADALDEAAVRAVRRQGYAAAVDAFSVSADLSEYPDDRARRLVGAAQAAELAGLPGRVTALADTAEGTTSDPLVHADLALLSGRANRDRDAGGVTGALEQAAVAVAGVDLRRAALLFLEAAITAVRCDRERAVALAERAVATTRRAGADTGLAEMVHGRLLHYAGRPRALATRVVLPDVDDLEQARVALWVVAANPVPDRAQQAFIEKVVGMARDRGALGLLPEALAVAGGCLFYLGDWAAAAADNHEAIELASAVGRPAVACEAHGNLARLYAFQGNEKECREQLGIYLRLSRDLGLEEDHDFAGVYEGELALTRGEVARAIRLIEPTWAARTVSRAHAGLIEAYLRVGRIDQARRSLDSLDRMVCETNNPAGRVFVARLRGMLSTEPHSSDGWFDRALAAADQLDWPFETARTELLYGERLRRDRRRREARPHLNRSAELFDWVGASPWAEHARRELAATGARLRPRSASDAQQLTPQELQLARIVAAGASNREAADRLFVSPKTVEAHLGSIYRKLGLRSRTELAARLHGRPTF